jgi:hypothetical protein
MGERRHVGRVLVGKPECKRPLERPRHRWEGNIKVDLTSVEREWIGLILLGIGTSGGLL